MPPSFSRNLAALTAEMIPLHFPGKITYVTDEGVAERAVRTLFDYDYADEPVLGFDIEWSPQFRVNDHKKTGVLQLCPDDKNCFVFHLTCLPDIPISLKRLLCATRFKKVGLQASKDMWRLQQDYGLPCMHIVRHSIVDLEIFARVVLRNKDHWSLAGLVEHLLDKTLPKPRRIRLGPWNEYPLSNAMLRYAALDAYAGYAVYRALKSKVTQTPEPLPDADLG